MARNPPWSAAENAVTVQAYLDMLEQELTGQSFNKKEINRRVMAATGRAHRSAEDKFQNISAVLRDDRCVYVDGYAPLSNYQQSLADEVRAQLARRPQLFSEMDAAVDAPAAARLEISWKLSDPPYGVDIQVGRHGSSEKGFHTDYVAREAANRKLGQAGEIAVLELERARLHSAGRSDLADRIRHVSKEEGDGLGYDILSYNPAGGRRLIEVKTTRRSKYWPMVVSRNEISVSEREAGEYVLSRVFAFASKTVGLYELDGAITQTCVLDPLNYLALPKASVA